MGLESSDTTAVFRILGNRYDAMPYMRLSEKQNLLYRRVIGYTDKLFEYVDLYDDIYIVTQLCCVIEKIGKKGMSLDREIYKVVQEIEEILEKLEGKYIKYSILPLKNLQ